MKIENSVVLVTGGNRGLGKALVDEALARNARKVYAAARDPKTVTNPDAIPLRLDVTDPESIAAAAREAGDVAVLINNAGVTANANLLTGDIGEIRSEFEINFYGPLYVTRAFAPIIVGNGGHLLNVLSVMSWLATGRSYSATKAAFWSMTNGLRLDLAPQGVGVTGLHVGYIDTDLAAHIDAPKISPEDVARQAIDGIENGAFEVLADEVTRKVKRGLSADPSALYPQLATE
ncbi:short-subunit dehydrogenase [Micromonospora palomenae]|uniref:Short-subunit dehydrogenase n=1 Tax=Micromonospora palomenae TaxID=1461247 RepID=A0A561VHA2_9ACTN|nr:SDR family oxidoreductase [Micromonospora palomenae]TWG10987.1 short-subunit dehydrogenase [Micromonospora palomenae]